MLAIQATKNTKVFLHMEADTFPNKGGFYCQVYEGDDRSSKMIEEFTISRFQLTGTPEERERKARLVSIDRIRTMFKR